jgi:nicotinamidase-related amidase
MKTALVLIDIQYAFDDLAYWGGKRNNPDAEKNAARLLAYWRAHQLPLFHVKHNSSDRQSKLAPGQPGNEIKDLVRPLASETLIEKNVNSAFIGTNLKKLLDDQSIEALVICGLTTDHCVSTTARMAGNYGYTTYIASDATATFPRTGFDGKKFDAELVHNTALASLHNEFATILSTTELLTKQHAFTTAK